MSEDLKDILTLSTYISDYKKKKVKKDGEPKRKSGNNVFVLFTQTEIGNREILSLTGGLFPIQPVSSVDAIHVIVTEVIDNILEKWP